MIQYSKDGRKRRSITLLFFLIVAIACTLPFLAYASPSKTIHPYHEIICVKQGDSLWNIKAREYPEEAEPWSVIAAIEKDNGLKDAGDLRAGQALILPVVR